MGATGGFSDIMLQCLAPGKLRYYGGEKRQLVDGRGHVFLAESFLPADMLSTP